jgi:hypothetical protein
MRSQQPSLQKENVGKDYGLKRSASDSFPLFRGLLYEAVSNSDYTGSEKRRTKKKIRTKYDPTHGILAARLGKLKKSMKILSRDSRRPGRNST